MEKYTHFLIISLLAGGLIFFGGIAAELSIANDQASMAGTQNIHSMVVATACRARNLELSQSPNSRVRGLRTLVPSWEGDSQRTSFGLDGYGVEYRVEASAKDVEEFYSSLPEYCWKNLTNVSSEGAFVYHRADETLMVAIAPISERASRVSYSLGVVLGESVESVQDPALPQQPSAPMPNISPDGKPQFIPFHPQTREQGNFMNGEKQPMPAEDQWMNQKPKPMFRTQDGDESGEETDREQKQLLMMQQQMGKMKLEVARVKRQMENAKLKLKKSCNLDLPEDVQNALSSIDGLMEKVSSATDATEAELAMEDLRDAMQTIREGGMDIQRLFRVCEKLRRLKSDVSRLDRESKPLLLQADKSDNAGVKQFGQDLKTALATLKDQLEKVRTAGTPDDMEAELDETYESVESVNDSRLALQLTLEAKKNLVKMKIELKRIESEIAKAAKAGKDVTEAKTLFEELKLALKELETLVGGSYTKDQLAEAIETIRDLKGELRDELDALLGRTSEFEPSVKIHDQNIQFNPSSAFSQEAPGTAAGS